MILVIEFLNLFLIDANIRYFLSQAATYEVGHYAFLDCDVSRNNTVVNKR
jgi:hypothetical protein